MQKSLLIAFAVFFAIALMSCGDSDSGSDSVTGADIFDLTQNPSSVEFVMGVTPDLTARSTVIWVENYLQDVLNGTATHTLTLDGVNLDDCLIYDDEWSASWSLPTTLEAGSSHSIVYHYTYQGARTTIDKTKSGTIVIARQAVYDLPEDPTGVENPMPFSWTLPADNQCQVAIANSHYYDWENDEDISDEYVADLAAGARSFTFPANCITVPEDAFDCEINYGIHSFNYSLSNKFLIISDSAGVVENSIYGGRNQQRNARLKLGEIIAKGF